MRTVLSSGCSRYYRRHGGSVYCFDLLQVCWLVPEIDCELVKQAPVFCSNLHETFCRLCHDGCRDVCFVYGMIEFVAG